MLKYNSNFIEWNFSSLLLICCYHNSIQCILLDSSYRNSKYQGRKVRSWIGQRDSMRNVLSVRHRSSSTICHSKFKTNRLRVSIHVLMSGVSVVIRMYSPLWLCVFCFHFVVNSTYCSMKKWYVLQWWRFEICLFRITQILLSPLPDTT